jgi:flagellin-like hook-associated protein FlgL
MITDYNVRGTTSGTATSGRVFWAKSIRFGTYENEFQQDSLGCLNATCGTGFYGSITYSHDEYLTHDSAGSINGASGIWDFSADHGVANYTVGNVISVNSSQGAVSMDNLECSDGCGAFDGRINTGVFGNRQTAIYFIDENYTTSNGIGPSNGQYNTTNGIYGMGAFHAARGLFDLNVLTEEAAAMAKVQVEAAINQINELRGVLAALQHQAESLINQRTEESLSTEAQISHITDTDYAKELAEFTKQQIAQQAGVNMLAQKRTQAQLITQLLR